MKIGAEPSLHQLLAMPENGSAKKTEASLHQKTPELQTEVHSRPLKEPLQPVVCFGCEAHKEYPTYTSKGLPKRPVKEHIAEDIPESNTPRPRKVFASKLRAYVHEHPETGKVLQDFREWRGPQKSSLEAARPSMEEFEKYMYNNPGVEQVVKEHMDFFQRYFERFGKGLRPDPEIFAARPSQRSSTTA